MAGVCVLLAAVVGVVTALLCAPDGTQPLPAFLGGIAIGFLFVVAEER